MRTAVPKPLSPGEETFLLHCNVYHIKVEREFRFHPVRKWRFDFAVPDKKIAVEVEGVTGGMGGRHQRRSGLEGDAYKYNAAAELSWTVLRYTPSMVASGEAIDQVLRILKSRV